MLRRSQLILLLTSTLAYAQLLRQPGPIDLAIQDYQHLQVEHRYEEAAVQREAIRALVERAPVESQEFVYGFNSLTQMYQQAGRSAEVRSMAQAALSRATRLPDVHPTKAMLLTTLANSWRQDGYLLKTAASLEQAAAAAAGAPPAANPRFGLVSGLGRWRPSNYPEAANLQRQLGDLYRELGRPDAAAAAFAEAATPLRGNSMALAAFYQQDGQFDEAESLYKQVAGDTRDPHQASDALQSLANLYQGEGRMDDAISAAKQAIALCRNSGDAALASQTFWQRQQLAMMMLLAGHTADAEQIYRQLLSEGPDESAQSYNAALAYAQLLNSTQRAGQSEKLLTDYLASHPDLPPGLAANALNILAGSAGDRNKAEAYRRAAAEKSPMQPPPSNTLWELVAASQKAAQERRLDEAYTLGMQAIDAALPSRDATIVNLVHTANMIGQKDRGKAGELYQRLFAAAEGWSGDTLWPLVQIEAAYVGFLSMRPEPEDPIRAAIERYAGTVAAASGAEAGAREKLNQTIELDRRINELPQAIFAAQERLRLEESLSGATSAPYLTALGVLARLNGQSGDYAHALPLYRQMITIADLTAAPHNSQAAQLRMEAALVFAQQNEFEEADRLAAEAVTIGKNLRPPAQNFDWQITQIRQMEQAAARRMGK